jgi:SAM-dependent methyltransferase
MEQSILALCDEETARAAAHWDERIVQLQSQRISRTRWWEDETTLRHINSLVGQPDLPVMHGAFHYRIRDFFNGTKDLKAISVGCGMGAKELWLMQLVDFDRFDLYDISSVNIGIGEAEAERQGVSSKANFFTANAFVAANETDYDLVYWNNSLHHMPDVAAAVSWSKERLKPGGLFAMDDFVGPDRFQWTDENLAWATRVRYALSERLLASPYADAVVVDRECGKPTVEEVIAADPSEAMDSGRILAEVRRAFPEVEIIPTGGALYHLALNDIFCNFVTESDLDCLRQILLLDELLAKKGTTQYAVAFGTR